MPLTNGVGTVPAAASLKVKLTPVAAVAPPASDIKITFCPPGPTSRMSMSAGKVWDRPLSVTVTFVTVPVKPETTIFDGYGLAGPLVKVGCPFGILINVELVKVDVEFVKVHGVGVGVGGGATSIATAVYVYGKGAEGKPSPGVFSNVVTTTV